MQSFAIDLLTLIVLGFFVWRGKEKGFFLSVTSILIFFAALIIGVTVANANTEKAASTFDDLLDWVAEGATEAAIDKLGASTSGMSEQQIATVAKDAFVALGVRGSASNYLSTMVRSSMRSNSDATLYGIISNIFVRSLAWVALFFVGYVIASLVLSMMVNFISTVFKFPVIRQIDMLGGLVLGFVQGLFVMFLVGFALRYFGVLVPHELLDKTVLLKFFIDVNPFGSIIKL